MDKPRFLNARPMAMLMVVLPERPFGAPITNRGGNFIFAGFSGSNSGPLQGCHLPFNLMNEAPR